MRAQTLKPSALKISQTNDRGGEQPAFHCGCVTRGRRVVTTSRQQCIPKAVVTKLMNDYRPEADAISGSIRASGFTMSSASLFRSSFASDSSSRVCYRRSADLSCPSSCAKVQIHDPAYPFPFCFWFRSIVVDTVRLYRPQKGNVTNE